MTESIGNPFRAPKPKKNDTVFKGTFLPATEKGTYTGASFARMRLVLTARILWLSEELTVPLSAIQSVERINKDKAVQIAFRHWLEQRDEVVFLCAQDFIGFYDRKKNRALVDALNEHRAKLPQVTDEKMAVKVEGAVREHAGCEKCGDKDAKMLHLGAFYCVGLYPIAGAYSWEPTRRYLCAKHAVRQSFLLTLATAVGGYWGFPGVLVAPIRVWANLAAVKKAFPDTSMGLLALAFLLGMAPLLALIVLIVVATLR